jgi:hypothetical protein
MATVTSVGYSLHVTLNPEIGDIVLSVLDEDGYQCHLQDTGTKKNTKLVASVLKKLADVWPKYSFQLQVDQNNMITGVL